MQPQPQLQGAPAMVLPPRGNPGGCAHRGHRQGAFCPRQRAQKPRGVCWPRAESGQWAVAADSPPTVTWAGGQADSSLCPPCSAFCRLRAGSWSCARCGDSGPRRAPCGLAAGVRGPLKGARPALGACSALRPCLGLACVGLASVGLWTGWGRPLPFLPRL